MAEEQGALSKAWTQGLEELRAANSGQMAMESPPIQPSEPPAAEQPSYSDLLNQQASMAEGRGESPDQGMSR